MKNLQEDNGIMMCIINVLQSYNLQNASLKNISCFVDVTFYLFYLTRKYIWHRDFFRRKYEYIITSQLTSLSVLIMDIANQGSLYYFLSYTPKQLKRTYSCKAIVIKCHAQTSVILIQSNIPLLAVPTFSFLWRQID